MRNPSPKRFTLCLWAMIACGLGACKTAPDEESLSGTLDPHSSASRARLDAAQRAFSGSDSNVSDTSSSDLSMKGFNLGSGDLSLGGFNTQDLNLKGYGDARDFAGAGKFAGADKNFGSTISPMSQMSSELSNQALAGESGKTFFGKRYGTKAYEPRGRGVSIPGFNQPKVTPVESLIDSSEGPSPEAVSVGDIRKLLNR